MTKYGVYRVSFKRSVGLRLSDWNIAGLRAEKLFDSKDAAANFASERRWFDKDERSTSRLRALGLWTNRYYVKKADELGRALVKGVNYN